MNDMDKLYVGVCAPSPLSLDQRAELLDHVIENEGYDSGFRKTFLGHCLYRCGQILSVLRCGEVPSDLPPGLGTQALSGMPTRDYFIKRHQEAENWALGLLAELTD